MSPEVDSYISGFTEPQRSMLLQIQNMGRELAPSSHEVISYKIPAVRLNNRMLFYYAGWRDHLSLYPIPAVDNTQMRLLKPYIKGKGTLQFSLSKALPIDIIEMVIRAHVASNTSRSV